MIELKNMHCSVITSNTPRMDDLEIGHYQAKLPDWEIYKKDGVLHLEKIYQFKNFLQAVDFTNQVAQIANEEDHHPAILTECGKVTVTWWTHKIAGLHLNDFIMAAKTDQLYKNQQ
jgi:4a-hydroxytetrahydrobiopterin dehydratase